jgi:hypothetical protein
MDIRRLIGIVMMFLVVPMVCGLIAFALNESVMDCIIIGFVFDGVVAFIFTAGYLLENY